MENDSKTIRHYGNKAISRRGFGFTLAEILIVLTIIGVMAVMTIPSLIQNSNSQQKITLFKKGFNAISNAYATEFAVKSPPKTAEDSEYEKMWDALNNQLNVKYYANADGGGKVYTLNEAKAITPIHYRVIVTEDGISYRVGPGVGTCKPKLEVNKYKSTLEMLDNSSCMDIGIILDGKHVIKNRVNCYQRNGGDKQDLNNLKCNTLFVPVTSDGITAGNPDCTIAGRIMSDNTTYDESKCQEATP